MSGSTIALLAVVAIVVVFALSGGKLPTTGQSVAGGSGSGSSSGVSVFTSGATIRASVVNGLNGTLITGGNDGILFSSDGVTRIANDVNINAYPVSISTAAPNTLQGGSLLLKNDPNYAASALASTTDRGARYYGTLVPVNYNGATTVDLPAAKAYAISYAPTYTTIDNGVVKTGTDFSPTVGSGATVDTTTIKFSPSPATSIGNPNLNGQSPVAVCFNTTATGSAFWKAVYPLQNAGAFPAPTFYSKLNVINGLCWKLATDSVADDQTGVLSSKNVYQFDLRLQAYANKNPAATENITMMLITKDYYIGDNGSPVADYGQNVVKTTARPIGFDPTESSSTSLLIGIL